eukprot:gene437-biopygen365
MSPATFSNMYTSRTIKAIALSTQDVQRAVQMHKFELCPPGTIWGTTLPQTVHAVKVFTVPELKGRRRLITEPLLNGVIDESTIPRLAYPSRLTIRESLRHAKYMLQLDFEA